MRIHNWFIFFRESSINALSFSPYSFESKIFRKLTLNLLFSRDNTIIPLSISWIHYEWIIFCAKVLWIHYLYREITLNSLSFTRIHYGFTIHFAKSLLNTFCLLRIDLFYHSDLYIDIFISFGIHHLYRKFTLRNDVVTAKLQG